MKNGNRSNSKQASEHSNNVIMSLQSKLADTSLGFKDILEAEVKGSILGQACPILLIEMG